MLQSKKSVYLLVGIIFYFFSTGRFSTSTGLWLAPFFLLLFLNSTSRKQALWIISLVVIFLFPIQWYNYIPAPMPLYFIICLGNAAFFLIPYLLHIGLYKKERKLSLLVFPSGLVLVEFLLASFSPYSSWGAMIYAQPHALEINQIASITGIYGISFLVGLVASVSSWAIANGVRKAETQKPLFFTILVFVLIWGYGSFRLQFFQTPKDTETIPISGVTLPLSRESIIFSEIDYASEVNKPLEDTLNVFKDLYLLNKSIPDTKRTAINTWFSNFQSKLLTLTEEAADKGAQVIVWSEGNGICLEEQEDDLINRCRAVAKAKQITLFASLNTKIVGEIRSENKIVAIDSKGDIVFTYLKSFPVPGAENSVAGEGKLPLIETPYGNLTAVICFDADFPQLVRNARSIDADALIVPAYDWAAINPYHTQMSAVRAIENGIPLFRQANSGLSAAYDNKGRMVASADYQPDSKSYLFSTHLQMHKSFTFYSIIGDWLPMLSIVLLVVISVIHFKKSTKKM